MVTFTPNFKFALPALNQRLWNVQNNNNFALLDTILSTVVVVAGFKGIWANATAYVVGDRVTDAVTGQLFECLVANTSAVSGEFSADRAANPTYWSLVTSLTPSYRGTWQPNTVYRANEFTLNNGAYYICNTTHTSGSSFSDTNWDLLIDLNTFNFTDALTAISPLTPAADRFPYYTGSTTAALATLSTFGRSLTAAADAAALRGLAGIPNSVTVNRLLKTSTSDGALTLTGVSVDANSVVSGTQGVILDETSSAPGTAANTGAVYAKVVGGQTELFYREESNGDEIQITNAGRLFPRRDVVVAAAGMSGSSAYTNTNIASWATRITISLKDFSTNGSVVPELRLGTSAGIQTSDYVSRGGLLIDTSSAQISGSASGYRIADDWAASMVVSGNIYLELHDATNDIWTCSFVLSREDTPQLVPGAGINILPGTLDRISLTTTDTIDDGTITIYQE